LQSKALQIKKCWRMHFKVDSKQGRGAFSNSNFRNVLAFHKLTKQLTFGSTNYSPRRFEQLLNGLIDSGFEFVPLSTAVTEPLANRLAITFDDGYAHLLESLPQFLEKFKLKPTVFIPTAFIGQRNSWDYSSHFKSERHLTKSEILELLELGVEFGSHGHLHRDFRRCTSASLTGELSKSKKILEDITGKEVHTLSYPFGRTSTRVCEVVNRAGFDYAFTMSFPENSDSPIALGRIPVYFFDNSTTTRQKLAPNSMRSLHKALGNAVNFLSFGTILLNLATGQTGQIKEARS
jgi:peptidoglycan/xylan/chitin deacetylase (PgdA/CDA1 family)